MLITSMKFKGIITALITPFYQKELDRKSFIHLVQKQLEDKVDGLVINGTTGESPTLQEQEVEQLVTWAQAEIAGQVPLILGVGHYNTNQAYKNIQKAQKLKVDAVLAVVPYYNKPSQDGLSQHFSYLAHSTDLPLLLYNVPSRTSTSLNLSTILELSKISNITGIKEASGDIAFGEELLKKLPSNFTVVSGDDSSFLDLAYKGAHGVISVCSHLIAPSMKKAFERASQKDVSAIQEFKNKYGDFIDLLFKVSNPMMIKQFLYAKKWIQSPELRLPLCEPPKHLQLKAQEMLQKLHS